MDGTEQPLTQRARKFANRLHGRFNLPIAVITSYSIHYTKLYELTLFRCSNLQKHRFRSDPHHVQIWGKPAEFIETRQGNRLLVSGFV